MLKYISITLLPPPPATPWVTLAEAQQRATVALNLLNSEYNNHGIFLVGNNGVCGSPIVEVSVFDFGNLAVSAVNLRDNNGIQHSDGIDVYIFTTTESNPSGYAYHVPNNFCSLRGFRSPGNIPAENTEIMIHEIGHCLGLSHTYTGASNEPGECEQEASGCNCDCFGVPPGYCCGDYVDDTEINPYHGGIQVNAGCNPIPTDVTTNSTLNYMSYVVMDACRSQFTPGQVLRMRYYLFNAPVLQNVQPKTMINNPPSNVTMWNATPPVSSSIVIPTGQTLIINGTLEMPPGAYIYVERGAQLQINGTITGACGKMWRGVIVNGSDLLPQTTAQQGYVKVNPGGTIEHAVCGIQLQGLTPNGAPNPSGSGGMAFSNGGFLKNCTQAVKYTTYKKQANTGRFFNTSFSMDDNYRGEDEKIEMAHLTGIYGLIFNGCAFTDSRDFCNTRDDRATGIKAYDASFVAMQGSFDGLDYGVHASTLITVGGFFSVSGNEFTDCFTGVYSTEAPGFRVTGNTFNMNRLDECDNNQEVTLIGVYAKAYAANALISGNDFIFASNDPGLEILTGTEMDELGTSNNEIHSNSFIAMTYGNRARGVNGGQMGEMQFSGLLYECNGNENALEGDFLVEYGQVRLVQGEEAPGPNNTIVSTAAGNTFGGFVFGFRNDGTPLTYYYKNGLNEDPGNSPYSSGITKKIANNENPSCGGGSTACPNPPCPELVLTTTKSNFFQNKQTWLNKINAFPNIMSAAQKALEQSAISQLRLELDRDARTILHSYQLDTVSIKTDSILTWLQHLETYEADYHRARHHFFSGNFVTADNIFATLPSKYGLSGERLAIHNEILEILDILYPHLSSGGIIGALPQTVLDDLEPYAEECNEAGFIASDVLERNGIVAFPVCQEPGNRSSTPSGYKNVWKNGLIVFPNPAKDQIQIHKTDSPIYGLQLFDVNGKQVQHPSVEYADGLWLINTSGLSSGFYCIRIISEDGASTYGKVLIQH